MKPTPGILVLRVLVVAFSASLFAGYVVFTQQQAQSATTTAPTKAETELAGNAGGGGKRQVAVAPTNAAGGRFLLSGTKSFAGATMVTEQLRQISEPELTEVSRRRVMSGSKSGILEIRPGVPGITHGKPEARRLLEGALSRDGSNSLIPGSESGELMGLARSNIPYADAGVTKHLRPVMDRLLPEPSPKALMLELQRPTATDMSGHTAMGGKWNHMIQLASTSTPRVTLSREASGNTIIISENAMPPRDSSQDDGLADTSAVVMEYSYAAPIDGAGLSQSWANDGKPEPMSMSRAVKDLPFSVISLTNTQGPNEFLRQNFISTALNALEWPGAEDSRFESAGTLVLQPVIDEPLELHYPRENFPIVVYGSDRAVFSALSKFGPVLPPWTTRLVKTESASLEASRWRYYTGAHWDLRGAIRDLERRLKRAPKKPGVRWTGQVMPSSKLGPVITELPEIPSVIDLTILSMPQGEP
jgi:hypothetical protein